MKNVMQLKAIIKKFANDKKIMPQAVLQNYMLERLIERISRSQYKDKFVLKGGMLIAAFVGIDIRTTMDMDVTLKNMPLTKRTVEDAFNDIFTIQLSDNITFKLLKIENIRGDDAYGGYRASINAIFDILKVTLKIDLTTGDKITPKEIKYKFNLLFEDRTINILAYNPETVLAEKYETILRRSVLNTRIRDFYDVYILINFYSQNINKELLLKAIEATLNKRESKALLLTAKATIEIIKNDEEMQSRWKLYQKDFNYAKDINWNEVMAAIEKI
ncbi:MAG: nucleotidyl transferase AbiEii/AbiGii toxin family protein [Candidatus Humimicrobiaceae bacterium]